MSLHHAIAAPVIFIALLLGMPFGAIAAGPAPSGQGAKKDYWLKNRTLLASSDPRSVKAHAIFDKVLAAADRRPGPNPELFIIDEEGFPWARSLPDGSIILTRGAIDICFNGRSKDDSDARLAFVLGHELSHQVNRDFWHFFFYQGARPVLPRDRETKETLEKVIKIAKSGDSVSAKELQADQYGLLYASQAGYNVKNIVDTDSNFFREWTAATNPGLLEGIVMQASHPKIEERSTAVILALKRVVEKIELFDKGVESYKSESYIAARHYFEKFLSVYQSREAYNNLGLVYYQMAVDEFIKWKPDEPPFRLSLIIDTETRAKKTFVKRSERGKLLGRRLRGEQNPQSLFGRYASLATRYFREAAQRDHTYATAHNNLACVYFLKSEFSSAVGELDKAVSLDPSSPEAFNNRAVAYFKLGSRLKVDLKAKTEADLLKAIELKPDYADALFNLAYFYKLDNRKKEKDIYTERFTAHSNDKELINILR